ncbi:MAG TPA: carbohydrate kinase, partial [Lachnospiraceae bacterium]|nr:carbohydrate kinase [Lachnospiraceae bacterium]
NEITFMTGEEDLDKGIHKIIEEYKIPLVFATFGPDGSKAYCGGVEVYEAGFLNPDTIETTGAGDTFCASALYHVLKYGIDGLKNEAHLHELLTFANAAASLVTTKKGALCVMPTVDEVKAYIQKSGR